MPVITIEKEKNLWEDICAEFAAKRSQGETAPISTSSLISDNKTSDAIETKPTGNIEKFNPALHTPVFCNYDHTFVSIDDARQIQFDTRISHPACIGYALTSVKDVERPSKIDTSVAQHRRPITPAQNIKQMSTIEYLERFVYPTLLKGIEQLLIEAERRKCFERKRTAFNALDYLTRYLFYMNSNRLKLGERHQLSDEEHSLETIPFVHDHLAKYPRAPLPKSLLWTEEEAALIIQAFYRGYRVRKEPEIQELRVWQREWRESNRNIHDVVEDFWRQHSSPAPGLHT